MKPEQLDTLSYYEILGVEPSAGFDEIRDAFHEFSYAYHPDYCHDDAAEQRDIAERVFRRGSEAYRVLTDPRARRLYDAQLANGELRFTRNVPPPSGKPGSWRPTH